MSKKTILIIDDDQEFTDAVKSLLESRGYKTMNAADGEAGIALVKKENPDLILLDVMMKSDNEGFLTAQKLKEEEATKAIPIIMVTGIKKAKNLPFGFEPDEEWLPVKAVVEKPIKPDDFLAAVKAALE